MSARRSRQAREAGGDRCIVLTGLGTKRFWDERRPLGRPRVADETVRFRDLGRRVVDRVANIPKPVIAATCGWCIGCRIAIAMAADVGLASMTAKFGRGRVPWCRS